MKNRGYWLSVILNIVIVISVNLFFDFRIGVLWEFLLCLIVIISPAIVLNFIDRFIPKKWYDERKLFEERKFEKKFFENIKIKKWKDSVPQFLKVDNINEEREKKNKIEYEYIEHFIDETRRGEFMHLLDIILGLMTIFFLPSQYLFRYCLPIALIWIFYNMLSIIIQRYNRPRLKSLSKTIKKKQEKEKIKQSLPFEADENLQIDLENDETSHKKAI